MPSPNPVLRRRGWRRTEKNQQPSDSTALKTDDSSIPPRTLCRKYSIIVVMALSLTVLYGTKYTVFVGDYKPTSFADYNRFRALQPGLRCSCGVQISPFSNFASASVDTNPTCAWVTQDLIGYARENACPSVSGGSGSDALGKCDDLSTCRSAGTLPLCQATDESCKQSNQTIEWILQEFRNTPVSSTDLLAQDTLEKLVNQTFESAIKLGSLISTTPVKTVEAWASLNMPEIVGNIDAVTNEVQNIAKIGLRTGNHLQTCTDCSSSETAQMTSFATNQRRRYEEYSRVIPPPEVGFQSSNFKTGCGYTNAWLETKMEPDTADTDVAVNYYLKPGTIGATVGGVTYQNYFDALAEGNLPVPDKDTYFFNQSKTTGCDPYSAALDTTYFAYDTPEKLVEAWNVTAGEIDRYFRANIAAAGEEVDKSWPGGNYDARFADRYGPGSRSDYEPKFAIPIMKRHGTLRNAISNLFIDEKVVSVNYEVSDPLSEFLHIPPSSPATLTTRAPPHPFTPTPGLLRHVRHHLMHLHVQSAALNRGAHLGNLRPDRRYRRLHETSRRFRLRHLQGSCVERRGGSVRGMYLKDLRCPRASKGRLTSASTRRMRRPKSKGCSRTPATTPNTFSNAPNSYES